MKRLTSSSYGSSTAERYDPVVARLGEVTVATLESAGVDVALAGVDGGAPCKIKD